MKLHNTATHQKELFEPISLDQVTLYTCGPTVYDQPTIGNWIAYIRWDTLIRVLKASGYHVKRVMNITDVGHLVSDADDGEDKMLKGAKREGLSMQQIADKYTGVFMDGMRQLNLIEPDHMPKATKYIPQQIRLIERLEAKGFTYKTPEAIYFDTSKFPNYANFARLDLSGLLAGARVNYDKSKKNASDFALWKSDITGKRTEMIWDSPWGKGFPGWHIECSAMALDLLGESIDIHTGGIDHIPVHHTNEIAQSEGATAKKFVNYWLHNSHLLVGGTKISKSLQNGYTLEDLISKGFSPMDYRLFALQSHYRTESNFTWENLHSAQIRLKNIQAFFDLRFQDVQNHSGLSSADFENATKSILGFLQDDLDTPKALSELHSVIDAINTKSCQQPEPFLKFLIFIDEVFGLALLGSKDINDSQKQLISQREVARSDQNWLLADQLRLKLQAESIEVKDTDHGSIWFRN